MFREEPFFLAEWQNFLSIQCTKIKISVGRKWEISPVCTVISGYRCHRCFFLYLLCPISSERFLLCSINLNLFIISGSCSLSLLVLLPSISQILQRRRLSRWFAWCIMSVISFLPTQLILVVLKNHFNHSIFDRRHLWHLTGAVKWASRIIISVLNMWYCSRILVSGLLSCWFALQGHEDSTEQLMERLDCDKP